MDRPRRNRGAAYQMPYRLHRERSIEVEIGVSGRRSTMIPMGGEALAVLQARERSPPELQLI
ncbi:MAG: hypothetical protein U0838_16550 [Chloroflexota bacterium]